MKIRRLTYKGRLPEAILLLQFNIWSNNFVDIFTLYDIICQNKAVGGPARMESTPFIYQLCYGIVMFPAQYSLSISGKVMLKKQLHSMSIT